MLTIHVWPKRLKEFLLTHPLYKSPILTPPLGSDPQSPSYHIPRQKVVSKIETTGQQL